MNDTFTYFQKKGCTVFSFPGKTRVLSTSPLNGGITAHLTHALNINCMNGAYECEMLGNTYEEDLNIHTKELGIDPQTATAHYLLVLLIGKRPSLHSQYIGRM